MQDKNESAAQNLKILRILLMGANGDHEIGRRCIFSILRCAFFSFSCSLLFFSHINYKAKAFLWSSVEYSQIDCFYFRNMLWVLWIEQHWPTTTQSVLYVNRITVTFGGWVLNTLTHTHRQRAVDVVTFYFFWHSILLWWLSTLSSHDHIVGICFVWTPYKRFHVWLVLLTRTVRHHQLSSYNHNVNIVQHFHYYVQNETNEYYMYIFCDNLPELKLYLIRIHHASTRSIERNVSAKEFWHS